MLAPTVNEPQAQFLAMPHKFRALVCGFGAGKTWGICAGACKHYWEHPRAHRGYFAPTYTQIRDIYYPTIEEVADDWGLKVRVSEGNKEVHFYSGRRYRGTTICRSMEKPESIVGFKIARADIDEIDTLDMRKAERAWQKIIARLRLRYDGVNGADVATTPEGFKFTYKRFEESVRKDQALRGMYGLTRGSTYDNEANLPDDYIPSLLATYPPQLIQAYLDGEFVNLTSGTVYNAYNRELNKSTETIRPKEALYIGMDFNVGKMAAIVHVLRDGNPHAVDEIIDGYDTPDMITRLRERYWEYDEKREDWIKTHEIVVYPDASGGARQSAKASTTDLSLLRAGGFRVDAPASNPPVKDRINAMNAMFCNAQGQRRYRVNAEKCPTYSDHLVQQIWTESGEPDKSSGNDHTNDAGGYYIHRKFPLVKPTTRITTLRV